MRAISSFLLIAMALGAEAQTTFQLTNQGFTFSPDLITMQAGDSIHLVIPSPHHFVEVTQSTWDANGNTSNGGLDFLAGEHTFSIDVPGTYYYVCFVHASMGMKGRIIVTGSTSGIKDGVKAASSRLFPNPATSKVRVAAMAPGRSIEVFELSGKPVLGPTNSESGVLDVSGFEAGSYVVVVKDAKGTMMSCERLVVTR